MWQKNSKCYVENIFKNSVEKMVNIAHKNINIAQKKCSKYVQMCKMLKSKLVAVVKFLQQVSVNFRFVQVTSGERGAVTAGNALMLPPK